MKYKLVIFDFDGTLADTFPFFLDVFDILADTHGFRRLDRQQLDTLRSFDARRMMRHVGLPMWKMPRVAMHFRALMAQHSHRIALFDGIAAMLQELAGRGVALAVLTSNSEQNVRAILGPDNAALIAHYACGVSLFGKRSKLRHLLAKTGTGREQVLCVGDELRDIDAAHGERLDFGAVAWGYTHPEALRARQPAHVFSRVEEIAAALA